MSLTYTHFTEEADKMRNLLTDGEYHAKIIDVKEENSKGGKDKNGNLKPIYKMLVLDLSITDMNGRERKLKDWVMLEGEMAWKFRHLARACDLMTDYDNNSLEIWQFKGKTIIADIKTRDGVNQYGEKVKRNNIADYGKPIKDKAASDDFFNDDIPSFA